MENGVEKYLHCLSVFYPSRSNTLRLKSWIRWAVPTLQKLRCSDLQISEDSRDFACTWLLYESGRLSDASTDSG